MKIIDVCSKPCPQPVIETKKAMDAEPGTPLKVIVDDEAAKENVKRFAVSRGYGIEEIKSSEKTELILTPEDKKNLERKNIPAGKAVYFIESETIGSPDKELGELLMKTFLQTIPQVAPLPEKIVFMHGGVKHTVKNAKNIELVKALENLGIDIVVCGTCLDYYGLKKDISAGRISNFFEIVFNFKKIVA